MGSVKLIIHTHGDTSNMHWSPNPIICVTIGALLLSSASAAFLDNLVVANINDLYTSYLLSYTENDFKSLNFSSSILGGKAIVFNTLIVAGAVGLLQLLPETAFCFIKGTCPPKYGKPAERFYDNYRAHWKNQRQQQRREYDDMDYYAYDEPAIVKKKGLEAKRQKRESEDVEYVEYADQDYLPAEHRQSANLAQNRQSSNPIMAALSEMVFGNPLRRMTKTRNNVYQHYEDFWKFRLANPGANYRHHLKRIDHQKRLRNYNNAQSREQEDYSQ